MKIKTNSKIKYTAVFEKAEEGGYNVFFPSFPGCVTFGRNFEEAKEKAAEVLELWLAELSANKEKIPVAKNRPIIDEVQIFMPAKAKIFYAPSTC